MAMLNGRSILFSPTIHQLNIDQHYDPTSENAQSGIAVNEAVTRTTQDILDWVDNYELPNIPNYATKITVGNVLERNVKYILGEQSSLNLTMPTPPAVLLGDTVEVVFSSGVTACNLTCDLQGFDFVPKANKTNKIVFEYVATGKWTVSVKESA